MQTNSQRCFPYLHTYTLIHNVGHELIQTHKKQNHTLSKRIQDTDKFWGRRVVTEQILLRQNSNYLMSTITLTC